MGARVLHGNIGDTNNILISIFTPNAMRLQFIRTDGEITTMTVLAPYVIQYADFDVENSEPILHGPRAAFAYSDGRGRYRGSNRRSSHSSSLNVTWMKMLSKGLLMSYRYSTLSQTPAPAKFAIQVSNRVTPMHCVPGVTFSLKNVGGSAPSFFSGTISCTMPHWIALVKL